MTFLKGSAFFRGGEIVRFLWERIACFRGNLLLLGSKSPVLGEKNFSVFGKQVARFGGENFFCFWEASRPLPLIYAERNALTPVSAKRRGSSVFTPFPPSEKGIAFVMPAAPTGNSPTSRAAKTADSLFEKIIPPVSIFVKEVSKFYLFGLKFTLKSKNLPLFFVLSASYPCRMRRKSFCRT